MAMLNNQRVSLYELYSVIINLVDISRVRNPLSPTESPSKHYHLSWVFHMLLISLLVTSHPTIPPLAEIKNDWLVVWNHGIL